jgi:UPF0755 protein
LKFLATLLLVVLIVAAAAAFLIYAPVGPAQGTPDKSATFVDIAPGTGTHTIAAQLEHAGVIRNRYAFELLRLVKRGRLVAGEYRFNHPAPATEVYARLNRGDVFYITITVPEGYNIFDIAQAVARAGIADRETFLAAERTQTSLISDLSPNAQSLEGFLFPDTYELTRHSTPLQILSTMVRRFRKISGQINLADSGRSVADTVTLASLVEKEVAQNSERPLVAGVFVNRLAHNIPLATDPSIIYAALLNRKYRGTIYQSDLQAESPYNTYRHTGLPAGPICNPGVAALKAAIAPAHTDYVYFVADAQGHSMFSSTLAEHDRQIQQYRRALRSNSP